MPAPHARNGPASTRPPQVATLDTVRATSGVLATPQASPRNSPLPDHRLPRPRRRGQSSPPEADRSAPSRVPPWDGEANGPPTRVRPASAGAACRKPAAYLRSTTRVPARPRGSLRATGDTQRCTPGSAAHVKPEHDASAARPWPSVKQPTVRTDRPSGTDARPLTYIAAVTSSGFAVAGLRSGGVLRCAPLP